MWLFVKLLWKVSKLTWRVLLYIAIFIIVYMFLPVRVYKFPFQTEAQYHSRAGIFWFESQGNSQIQSPVLVASLSSFLWSTTDWTLPGNHRAGKMMEDTISWIISYHCNRQPHHYTKWLTGKLILFLATWHSWHGSQQKALYLISTYIFNFMTVITRLAITITDKGSYCIILSNSSLCCLQH